MKQLFIWSILALAIGAHAETVVKTIRVPNGGIQPQVAVDSSGMVHIVYFEGDAGRGDIMYVKSLDWGETFSTPVRVNSQPGSAIAVGNIRGAQLALGKGNRVHVAWNGSNIAEPKTADGKAPMLYTRLLDSGQGFEPQRNLIQTASGIDGGGALAADGAGNVYVFWHAPLPNGKDEGDRRVWLAKSADEGKTFAAEKVAFAKPTGVCGCCGLKATVNADGVLYLLFRSASENVHRDMYLLTSADQGSTFGGADISAWNVAECVMSSQAFAARGPDLLAAWETEKQVFFTSINSSRGFTTSPTPAPGYGNNRKHPAIALNNRSDILLVWTEGMGWKKGGTLYWQIFDMTGHPVGETKTAGGVPVWSLVATFPVPDGSFRIVY